MLKLNPEQISLDQLRQLWSGTDARLDDAAMQRVAASAEAVERIVAGGETVYGVNTGFGLLANTRTTGSPSFRPTSSCRTAPASATRCRVTSRG